MPATSLSQDDVYRSLAVTTPRIPLNPLYGFPRYFIPSALKAYPFAIDNFAGWMPKLDLQDKRIAGICGSGDFVINAFLMGAKEIMSIDIMETACLFGELKIAAIKRLSYIDYLSFLATPGPDIFNSDSYAYHYYERVCDLLSVTARDFFDQLIKPTGNNPYLSPGGLLVCKIGQKAMPAIIRMNPYLKNASTYELAKKRIKTVLFFPQDITQFLCSAQTTYDMVYLSNTRVYNPSDKDIITSLPRYTLTPETTVVSIHHLDGPAKKRSYLLSEYKAEARKQKVGIDVNFVKCEFNAERLQVAMIIKKRSWLTRIKDALRI